MATLTLQHIDALGELVNADTVKLSDSSATYGIKNLATGAAAVAPTSTISPISTGIYSYSTTVLDPGVDYEAYWEVVYQGLAPQYYVQRFQIDPAAVLHPGPTLAEIEAEIARRIGPYYQFTIGVGSAVDRAIVSRLKSSLLRGGYDDMYLLRRGKMVGGTSAIGFNSDDRIRTVKSLDVSNGGLVVDRNYTITPAQNEIIELLSMDPDAIRYCALEGLRRAYLVDTVELNATITGIETDFTALAPWLTETWQVQELEAGWNSVFINPVKVGWWKPLSRQGRLKIRSSAFWENRAIVTALRPAYTLVNGMTNMAGPDDDDDYVHITKEYAASAGHCECWRYYPAFLTPLAQAKMGTSMEDAAKVFTKEGEKVLDRIPQRVQPPGPYGIHGVTSNAS